MTFVDAVTGWTSDRLAYTVSDVGCFQGNEAYQQERISRGEPPWPRCGLVEVMREALKEQWPKEDRLFIAVPRRGLETELTELLMLEALKEEADAGDAHAQQLLAHLVEESGVADVSELITAQRSRVEEMQHWQQEQLRLHAEAVARTEQRASQRKSIKAVPPAASPVVSSATPKSSAAATASYQINERKHAHSSSASAAASASASVIKVDNGHGSLASDASSELSSAQPASAAELACSWTADAALTDVASLLQTGRRKFGVIVKAAVKFLHSLHPTSVNQSGSHRVFHFGQTGPVTLVIPHAGRRSKDNTVSRQYCTRLYEAMAQATMSQFGSMHAAAAQVEQAQPQLQLKAAASSPTAALVELD
jgi:hypothetical protein